MLTQLLLLFCALQLKDRGEIKGAEGAHRKLPIRLYIHIV